MTSPLPAPLSLGLACPAESFWERWCRNASPDQKSPILPPAIRSGVVQLHQLPVPGLQANRNAVQTLIACIVANRPAALDPVAAACVRIVDETLDDDQRHAVSVALGSPDLSLIVGYPGSGKSRVVAEILRQAAGRSRRVLFASPTGAALDRVIDRAPDLGPHFLRCAGVGETLPPRSAALSLHERIRRFDEETLPAARHRAEEARAPLARLATRKDAWPLLRHTPARLEALATRRAALERQRDTLASAVETEWASASVAALPPECAELRQVRHAAEQLIDARLRQVAERLQTLKGEATRLGDERASLTAQTAGRGRWWHPSFWGSRRQPDPAPRLAELDDLLTNHHAEAATLEQERATLEAALHRSAFEYAARSETLCRAEVQRRAADIARELHAVDAERAALEAEWSAVLPAEVHPDAIEAAEQAWRAEHAAASEEFDRRQAWLSALEQARPGLAFEFVVGARILAAPVPEVLALGTDRSPAAFDLLVLEDAHRLAEKDLLALARLAPRCILIGEPGVPVPKSASPRAGAARPTDPSAALAFLRLWAALHPDPIRVSAHWSRRGGRLFARLQPFGPGEEKQIAREPVFDRPEIELAIRTPPGGTPQLVEVVFPSSMGVADAKAFLYRESGELSIDSAGPGFRWQESEDGVHLHFGPPGAEQEDRVGLEAGVVERLGLPESDQAGDPAGHTVGLSFARSAGWDRDSAASWLAERIGLRDLGRTAFLPRVYRARPALASFLGELIFPRATASMHPPRACDAAEFIPCGDPREWSPPHDAGPPEATFPTNGTTTLAPRVGRPRLGAGLEVDLSDARRLDAIGPELRSGLPPRGIVNLPEAYLVVRTLEALEVESPFLASAGDAEPHVAVLSLHPAQVELLRLLVRRSPTLAESGLRILVGHPSALAHRDCPVVCVSLTRSHNNRAVPFSDDPRDLVLALTRATGRLLVFGDPGTMTRRSQWFGALDHLTEATGPVEQHLLARLLDRLPERAPPIPPDVALESSGV